MSPLCLMGSLQENLVHACFSAASPSLSIWTNSGWAGSPSLREKYSPQGTGDDSPSLATRSEEELSACSHGTFTCLLDAEVAGGFLPPLLTWLVSFIGCFSPRRLEVSVPWDPALLSVSMTSLGDLVQFHVCMGRESHISSPDLTIP